MAAQVVTVVDFTVETTREAELLDGFRSLIEGEWPEGLVRSELLRGQDGAWRIQTTWRDLDTLAAVRAAGRPPAALALLDRLGVAHSHTWFTVEQGYQG